MVVVAHPDDIEFGCAGTVAKWVKYGCRVVYVVVTSGNIGTHDASHTTDTLAEVREREQLAAAAVCGVRDVEFLRYHDGEVMPTLELRKDIVRMIRKHKPEVVFGMDPTMLWGGSEYINHPDHRAVGLATLDAIAPVASMPLMYPELGEAHRVREVWIQWPQEPDTWVDITETVDVKMEALRQHKSQVSEETVQGVRGWALEAGKRLVPAEAYKVMTLVRREEPAAQAEAKPAEVAAETTADATSNEVMAEKAADAAGA